MAYFRLNKEKNGIEIYFDKKPSENVRDELKNNKWRWHNNKRCWYNIFSIDNELFAKKICGTKEKTQNKETSSDNKKSNENSKGVNNSNKNQDTNKQNDTSVDSIQTTKKAYFFEGYKCIILRESLKNTLGFIRGYENHKYQVDYYFSHIDGCDVYKTDFFDGEEIKVLIHDIDKYYINKGNRVKFQSSKDGILYGKVVSISEKKGEEFYKIQYYTVDSSGYITKKLDDKVEIKRIISSDTLLYESWLYPIKYEDTVLFVCKKGYETIGTVISVNDNQTIDVRYISYDLLGNSELEYEHGISFKHFRLTNEDIRTLSRDLFINDKNKQNIEDNETIINRIKDTNDRFIDAVSVQNDKLFRHQRAGTVLAEKYKKFAFFYDTGTGKTVMALDIIANKQKKYDARFLIIAPKSIIKTAWMDDAANFYPDMHILPLYKGFTDDKKRRLLNDWNHIKNIDYTNIAPYYSFFDAVFGLSDNEKNIEDVEKELLIKAHHYIINSELFIRNPDYYIKKYNISGVIMDESAILKNYNSKTAKVMRDISTKVEYLYLLSGKPAPNNVIEYFSQMKIVDPDLFPMSFDAFIKLFCYGNSNLMVEGNKKLFAEMVSAKSLIISKKDCLDLPDCIDVVRQIELPDEVMNDYNRLYYESMAIIKGMDNSEVFYSAQSKLAVLMKLRQMASGFFITENDGNVVTRDIVDIHNEKIKELNNILDQIEDEQVIIWCQFQHEIELVEKALRKRAPVVTAYGKTKDLENAIDEFKSGKAKYIIANPRTLKYGVTFVNCRYAIYYSFSYSAEDYDQSHDRNYRMGQKEICTYLYIQSADTIDEIMFKRVKNKLSNAEFFEQLIKDASKHGINYDELLPKKDSEIKSYMKNDSSLNYLLKEIDDKQRSKLLYEYMDKYTSENRADIDEYEPTVEDIERSYSYFFNKRKTNIIKTGFFKYDDIDIEDIGLSWKAYKKLKHSSVNTIGELMDLNEIQLMIIVREIELYYEIQKIKAEINLKIIKNDKYISRSLNVEKSENDDIDINDMIDYFIPQECIDILNSYGIRTIRQIRLMTSAELLNIFKANKRKYLYDDTIKFIHDLDIGMYDEKELSKSEIGIIKSEYDEDDMSIDELNLSVRSYNCLKRNGIHTVKELMKLTASEVRNIKNMGRKSMEEIRLKLKEFGLGFKDE